MDQIPMLKGTIRFSKTAVARLVPLALVPLAVGCAPAAETSATPAVDGSATATLSSGTSQPLPQATVLRELLAVIPDTPASRSFVQINDIALARKLFDITLPGPSSTDDALQAYLVSLSAPPGSVLVETPWLVGLPPNDDFSPATRERRKYLAFDVRDVDQTVVIDMSEPRRLEVLRGRFNPKTTESALKTCAECPQPQVVKHLGLTYYRWGEDFATNAEQQLKPPAFDRYGRGGRIAVQEKYVLRTVFDEGIESLIGAQRKATPSLADVEEFRLLADGMASLGAYALMMSDQTQGPDAQLVRTMPGGKFNFTPESVERMKTAISQGPLLGRYQVLAVGHGKDSTGRYLAIALVHPTAEAASQNVDLLRQRIERTQTSTVPQPIPWATLVQEAEIRAHGRLLLAKLRGERVANLWPPAFVQGEVLLVHE